MSQSIKSKERSFLSFPEWHSLLLKSPSWPFHGSQLHSLSLRTRLHIILSDAPSLIIDCLAMDIEDQYQDGWQERLNLLVSKVVSKFDEVTKWLVMEAEPSLFVHTPPKELPQEQMNYPDLVSAVLDSVSSTALLILDQLFRSLSSLRLQSLSMLGEDTATRPEIRFLLCNLGDSEYRQRRMLKAFRFVQKESTLAAKPLQFGLRQVQYYNKTCSVKDTMR